MHSVIYADGVTEKTVRTAHSCNKLTEAEIIVRKAKAGIRDLVSTGSKPADAYDEMTIALAQDPRVTDHDAAQLGQLLSMRRSLDHAVNTRLGNPPKTLADLQHIPPELCVTHAGEQFLHVFTYYVEDDGSPGRGPIVVFATKDDLIELFRSEKVRRRYDCYSCYHVPLIVRLKPLVSIVHFLP